MGAARKARGAARAPGAAVLTAAAERAAAKRSAHLGELRDDELDDLVARRVIMPREVWDRLAEAARRAEKVSGTLSPCDVAAWVLRVATEVGA